jgi:TetR/AcrR family transcriptional regulator, cholesterol catabolism regulator
VSASRQSKIAQRRAAAQESGSAEYLERHQRVLEAAAHRFNVEGFDRADLAAIATDAGIERANVYYYVESKEDLYLKVLGAVKTDIVVAAERISRAAEPAGDRLRMLMIHHLEELDRHYPYLYLRYAECTQSIAVRQPDNPDLAKVVRLTERHFAAFRAVARDGIKDGSFGTVLPAGTVAQTAVGMVLHTRTWFDPARSKLSGAELGTALADMLLQGLCR